MRVFFFGTEHLAATVLSALLSAPEIKIVGVVTQPPRPVGRQQELHFSPVHELATKNNLPIFTPEKLRRAPELVSKFQNLQPDLLVVTQYGQIIPQEFLDVAPRGAVNIHGSLLPQWRGASPLQAALCAGDAETGITFMLMDAEMDHGAILERYSLPISPADNFLSLQEKLGALAAQNIVAVLKKFLAGEILPQEQDHCAATFCKLLKKEDGLINFELQTATAIEKMTRAFAPWPGTTFTWSNTSCKIISAQVSARASDESPGTLFIADKKLFLATKDFDLEILQIQPASKKILTAAEFLNGHKL